jgi:hypothetical protein
MSPGFIASLSSALSITAPIFLLVVLGIAIKRLHLINDGFIDAASKLVFTLGLPCLLFTTIVKTKLDTLLNVKLIAVGLGSTLIIFFVLVLLSLVLVRAKRERGIFVQGSFRGNMGIIGLAFCLNAYGDTGIAIASVYMAALTILYNLLSVIILTQTLTTSQQQLWRQIVVNIIKNPIVISIVLGFIVIGIRLPIHPVLMDSGNYLAQMTLPLALLCIGGSINLKELRQSSFVSLITVTMKLVLVPAASIALALPFSFSSIEMGVVFLMAAAPTATASYIMVQAMKGNGVLAANIIVLSTLGSVLSGSIGIVLLRSWNII